MIFFVLIPRVWVGREFQFDDDYDAPLRNFTGFTNEVQLGELGQILESNRPVMQVRCSDPKAGREIPVEQAARMMGYAEPLFRGSVMGRYENGRWHVLKESQTVAPLVPPREPNNRILQRIILHDARSRTLFGMHPIVNASFDQGLIRPRIDVATMILLRDEEDSGPDEGDIEYAVYSYSGRRRRPGPLLFEYRDVTAARIRDRILPRFLELPEGLERLRGLARELDRQVNRFDGSEQAVDERIAYRIEDYLGHNPDFTYSLRAEIVDPSIDPVEDFLFNRRSGHCEYYASAMALLLRAVGIPSRLVSGFKGGEQHAYSGAFVVEERHAHAWVEARINGRWRTFDPTPAGRNDSVQEVGRGRTLYSSARNFLTALWQQRIVRLSMEEQQQQIYLPLTEVLKQMAKNVSDLAGADSQRALEILMNPRRWFSIPVFVGTAVFLSLLFLLRRLWRRLFPENRSLREWLTLLKRSLHRLTAAGPQTQRVEFYERLVKLLARHGLARHPAQTPQEFAVSAAGVLATRQAAASLQSTPEELTLLFYRVRFGQQPLTADETDRLDTLLHRLEAALADDQ